MANTNWTPNAKQVKFLEVLKDYPNGATFFELNHLAGHDFATGAVVPLVKKGLVVTEPDKRVFECEVVFNGQVVGHTKKEGTVYKLAVQGE